MSVPRTLVLKRIVPPTSIHSSIEVDQTIATNIMIFRRQLMLLINIDGAGQSVCDGGHARTRSRPDASR